MKSLIFRISCVMFFAVSCSFAQKAGVSNVSDKVTLSGNDSAHELLHRDPFWPVGYIPRSERVSEKENAVSDKTKEETEQPRISLRESGQALDKLLQAQLNIDGFVHGTEGLLVFINGKVVGLGDQLTVKIKNTVYTLEICFLSKDSIKFKLLNNVEKSQNQKEGK